MSLLGQRQREPALLNADQQIFAARGEDLEIVIDGAERPAMVSNTIMPEAACTSTQYQVSSTTLPGY